MRGSDGDRQRAERTAGPSMPAGTTHDSIGSTVDVTAPPVNMWPEGDQDRRSVSVRRART